MMEKILGLDLGTNSIGRSVVLKDENEKLREIIGSGVRIIPKRYLLRRESSEITTNLNRIQS
jgi:CRISPR/Cas system Type II protein with McrA/HNH and RuvC-like nuclease domain